MLYKSMAKGILPVVVILSIITCCCHGYRYGPPMSACEHMFPLEHGHDARTDPPPFTFYLSQTTYNPNDTITVFLNSSINPENPTYEWFMEGVLIQARTLDCSQTFSVGTFSVPDCEQFLQPIDCFGLKNSAIRHYAHIHVYNTTFTWTAPTRPTGHLYFRATIARNMEKFWTNVFSEVIKDPTDSNTNFMLCPVVSKQSDLTSSSSITEHNTLIVLATGLISVFQWLGEVLVL